MDLRIFPGQTINLRPENWVNLSLTERISTLNAIETALATEEGREPSSVTLLRPESCESHEDFLRTRGNYQEGEVTADGIRQPGTISINPNLLETLKPPYMATETLHHEARHAYQRHVADHPELAENPDQAQLMAMNSNHGYLTPTEDGYELYTMQPNERDAIQTARQRTDEVFSGQLRDPQGYAEHKSLRQAEIAEQEASAEMLLGPEYIAVARQAVIEKYHQAMEQEKQRGVEQDRDRDHSYGYGY